MEAQSLGALFLYRPSMVLVVAFNPTSVLLEEETSKRQQSAVASPLYLCVLYGWLAWYSRLLILRDSHWSGISRRISSHRTRQSLLDIKGKILVS